jgi:hypothetical protein
MTTLAIHRHPEGNAITLLAPRHGAIAIRVSVPGDLAFIDALQKKRSKMVGFMPRLQLENNIKIKNGHVLIAAQCANGPRPSASGVCDRTLTPFVRSCRHQGLESAPPPAPEVLPSEGLPLLGFASEAFGADAPDPPLTDSVAPLPLPELEVPVVPPTGRLERKPERLTFDAPPVNMTYRLLASAATRAPAPGRMANG